MKSDILLYANSLIGIPKHKLHIIKSLEDEDLFARNLKSIISKAPEHLFKETYDYTSNEDSNQYNMY